MPGNSGGNARDNRQRGNAAQLLEKYKSMARDAQLAGDRVQTEYFLQFADHYFRVLEEGRSRFEDGQQQPQRRRGRDDEYDEEDGELIESDADQGDEDGEEESRQQPRRDRAPNRAEQDQRPERNERPAERSERNDRPRRERPPVRSNDQGEERIPVSVLPPAIGVESSNEEGAAATPRRRARKPRDAEGDEIAPAA